MADTIIMADDGRHVTVGRASQPTEEEIVSAEATLADMGMGGWLCRMSGAYHDRSDVTLTRLRALGAPSIPFEVAETRFLAMRDETRRA